MPASTVIPVLTYPDVRAAVAWLTDTFGFVERLRIGEGHRSQLRVGDSGDVIVADAGSDRRPPNPDDGVTHAVIVRVEDIDRHYARSVARGAAVEAEPVEYPFGERQYSVRDLAGHEWTFSQTVADVAPRDWGGELL